MSSRVVRLRPYFYIHVLDSNTNITRVEIGPKTFVRQDHETIVISSTPMINIPLQHYCKIGNPAIYVDGVVSKDEGQVNLIHGEVEVRLHDQWKIPFPLYPGEYIAEKVKPLQVVAPQRALRIMALRNCQVDGKEKIPGDEWLFYGPGKYVPRVEYKVTESIIASVVMPNQALKIRARRNFNDRDGVARHKGEEWLITKLGAYIPDVYEQVIGPIHARILKEKNALHLRALRTFTDVYGVKRRAGSEWLITIKNSQTHLPGINERVVNEMVPINILNQQQYCVVVNPIGPNGPQWGVRELRKGEDQFFLQPGEKLERGIQEADVLGADEALLLRARVNIVSSDEAKEVKIDGKVRIPGEEWLIYGPRKYIQPVEVEIVGAKRRAIPLDDNEGIYVRNTKTGEIRTIKGSTYMLDTHEEQWIKSLSPEIEQLLGRSGYRGQGAKYETITRDQNKAVTYRIPHNTACQIFDYKAKQSRVVIGPDMVMLEPFEEFTLVSLSGGVPKQENKIKSLTLALGPDFMNDNIVVETSDHARLSLQLSYNWSFDIDREDEKQRNKLFSVKDFVGDACKALASRVRGAVARQRFDDFHKSSAEIIRAAVFGKDADGYPMDTLQFPTNLLQITNVDIQSVEPVEQRTRDALAESVKLAIEITRQSKEKMANHQASKEEQIAQDKLQAQKIKDQAASEKDREGLVTLKAETLTAAAIGKARAEANARVEEAMIMAEAAVTQAEQKVRAREIRANAKFEQLKSRQKQQIIHQKALDKIEIDRAEKESEIEISKFKDVVEAIGPSTIEAIARAGPEMQAKLLEGLGLQGFLVTDGTSPINLFNTANGLVGGR